jgi:hypothetical protein
LLSAAARIISASQIKIQVAQDGFYQLTLDLLEETNLALETLNIENLHLSQAGTAVPYLISNDSLTFYGQAPDNRYVATRPYDFGKPGTSMVETSVPRKDAPMLRQVALTQHLEENNVYNPQALNTDDSDYWLW